MARYGLLTLDKRGLDKMFGALSSENRKPALQRAMLAGAQVIQSGIRRNFSRIRPGSSLGAAIWVEVFPSGEGAVVRRFYVKGGMGSAFSKDGPFYRSYILNFFEKGAQNRQTKGQGVKYRGKVMNRGSIPAYNFFSKGFSSSRNKAFKEMERIALQEIAKQARR